MTMKGKFLCWGLFLIVLAPINYVQARAFEDDTSALINKAEQDLKKAESETKGIYDYPEMKIAQEQLNEAKSLQRGKGDIVPSKPYSNGGEITTDSIRLPAIVSSLNSKIAIAKAQRESLAKENIQLRMDMGKLQAEANQLHTEAMNAQLELQALVSKDLKKGENLAADGRSALDKRMTEAEVEAARQAELQSQAKAEALKEKELAEAEKAKESKSLDNLRQQQVEFQLKLTALTVKYLNIREDQRGMIVSLSGVLFDVDKFNITLGGAEKISTLAQLLKNFPDRKILVEGHTDNTGTAAYNQALSEKRATTVENCLVENGVGKERIESTGFGEDKPVVTNATEAGRLQNRRVDVVILNPAGIEISADF